MQLVGAVQSLYTPISDGIFPYMVKTKNIKFLLKTVFLILPVVILGCMFCYEFSPDILRIICGEKYISADKLFRSLVPVLLFSYPVAILGTSGLGAIGKMRYVTISTIVAASVQVLGLAILAIFKCASIYFIAYIRVFTELLLLVFRSYYTYKNRKSFTM